MKPLLLHTPLLTICEIFPNNLAVDCVEGSITFADLAKQANELAREILASIPESKNDPFHVVVTGRKNANNMVAALAILIAGGIYVPIDPFDPPRLFERKMALLGRFILISTGMTNTLSATLRNTAISPLTVHDLAGDLPADIFTEYRWKRKANVVGQTRKTTPNDIAYVLFTSPRAGVWCRGRNISASRVKKPLSIRTRPNM